MEYARPSGLLMPKAAVRPRAAQRRIEREALRQERALRHEGARRTKAHNGRRTQRRTAARGDPLREEKAIRIRSGGRAGAVEDLKDKMPGLERPSRLREPMPMPASAEGTTLGKRQECAEQRAVATAGWAESHGPRLRREGDDRQVCLNKRSALSAVPCPLNAILASSPRLSFCLRRPFFARFA